MPENSVSSLFYALTRSSSAGLCRENCGPVLVRAFGRFRRSVMRRVP